MSEDPKEPINFRLSRRHKRALSALAAAQEKAVGELLREVVEAYVAAEERRAWENEARRAAAALAKEAQEPSSPEARTLETLEENLEEFAREWIWEDER
jgi:hypothetical protein